MEAKKLGAKKMRRTRIHQRTEDHLPPAGTASPPTVDDLLDLLTLQSGLRAARIAADGGIAHRGTECPGVGLGYIASQRYLSILKRLCCTRHLLIEGPFPRRNDPAVFVTGMPSAVYPFMMAIRIWILACCRTNFCAIRCPAMVCEQTMCVLKSGTVQSGQISLSRLSQKPDAWRVYPGAFGYHCLYVVR